MYLLAKHFDKQGCISFQTKHGKHLVSLMKKLNQAVSSHDIQIATISRPSAYGEYAPYTFAENEDSFCRMVLELSKSV